jgi:hypothetical protein
MLPPFFKIRTGVYTIFNNFFLLNFFLSVRKFFLPLNDFPLKGQSSSFNAVIRAKGIFFGDQHKLLKIIIKFLMASFEREKADSPGFWYSF